VGDLRGDVPVALPIYLLLSFVIVGFEGSGHYVEAAVVTVVTVVVLVYGMALPSLGQKRVVEQWAAGHEIDRSRAMDATYAWAGGRLPERSSSPLFMPLCSRSLSVRSPGRQDGGSSSTGSWASASELALC